MCIRDSYYPVYFGYDAKGEVCAVYVQFIDIEDSYNCLLYTSLMVIYFDLNKEIFCITHES